MSVALEVWQGKLIGVLLFAFSGVQCSRAPNAGASDPLTVEICGQTWMTRNLDVATYRNGDPIPLVTDPTAWVKLTTGAWCWYDNDSATYSATYGRLYNWYAVNDPRGLAPQGWHVLSDVEWSKLDSCLGNGSAATKLKEAGTAHWTDAHAATPADNSSGFTALPGGMRSDGGTFSRMGLSAVFWTSVEGSASDAWCGRLVHYVNDKGVGAMATGVGYMNKADGYSVRCVKDL